MGTQDLSRHAFLEFFAGAGMARLGLGGRWRCAWANDFDPAKAALYAAWFGDASDHLRVADIAEVDPGDLPGERAALAWSSFPCQDLSLAGAGRGLKGGRSGTFWRFWQLLSELRRSRRMPPIVVLENVVGLLRPGDFRGLTQALDDLDLRVGAVVIDGQHFVPQSRPRVFVVAVAADVDLDGRTQSEPASWCTTPGLVRAQQSLPVALRRRWVWWRLPAPADRGARTPLTHLIEADPESARWHTDAQSDALLGLMNAAHRARLDDPPTPVGTLYRRTRGGRQRAEVRFDGIAGCLRTPSGGSSRQTVVDLRSGRPRTRLLTAREAARLMGVPDDLPLPGSYNQVYKAMGDGVVVPAVRHLADHLLSPLADSL